ncbi:MAG: hypothetical protein PF689_12050 [Deltaproteobacteria bacterium]|jgi:hypothetical protein|nr:hypothetical protein [Deltaproteobacteria bacterium]
MKKQLFSQFLLLALLAFPLQAWSQIIIIEEEDQCSRHNRQNDNCDNNCPNYEQRRFRKRRRRRPRHINYYRTVKPAPYVAPHNQVSTVEAPDNLPEINLLKHWELSLIWSSSADTNDTYSGAGFGINLMFNQRWGMQGYFESVSNYSEEDFSSYNEIDILRAGLSLLWYPFGEGFTNKGFNFYFKAGITSQNYKINGGAVYAYDDYYGNYYDTEVVSGSSVELGAGLKYFFWDGWFSMTLEAAVLSDPFGEDQPVYSELFGSSSTFRFYTSFHF